MPTLDDLPPYRRAKLLWDFAHLGVEWVEQRVRKEAGRPCAPPRPDVPLPKTTAVLGDDGRFHLAREDRMLCSEAESERGWEHRQYCFWVEGDNGPEEARDAAPGEPQWRSMTHMWFVQPVRQDISPAEAPLHQRCEGGRSQDAFHHWPPPPAKTLVVRRLRAALVEALGSDCHLCGIYPGAMVDHDYATGIARGLLCARCNRALEECPHVDGCPKAEYMRQPPASHLALRYPRYLEWKPKESTRRRKIELLGFDPLADWRPA